MVFLAMKIMLLKFLTIFQISSINLLINYKNNFKLEQNIHPRWSKNTYLTAFHKIQEYIKAGDCYQINLTQEFKANFTGSLLNKADELWNLTNAPYSGYLKLTEFELLSCSPELFIEFNVNKQIKTRPIKGTMPRYENKEQDLLSKQTLKILKRSSRKCDDR